MLLRPRLSYFGFGNRRGWSTSDFLGTAKKSQQTGCPEMNDCNNMSSHMKCWLGADFKLQWSWWLPQSSLKAFLNKGLPELVALNQSLCQPVSVCATCWNKLECDLQGLLVLVTVWESTPPTLAATSTPRCRNPECLRVTYILPQTINRVTFQREDASRKAPWKIK